MAIVISSTDERFVLKNIGTAEYPVPIFVRDGDESGVAVYEMPQGGFTPQQSVAIAQAFAQQIPYATHEEAAWMVARLHAQATGIGAARQAEIAEGIRGRI